MPKLILPTAVHKQRAAETIISGPYLSYKVFSFSLINYIIKSKIFKIRHYDNYFVFYYFTRINPNLI